MMTEVSSSPTVSPTSTMNDEEEETIRVAKKRSYSSCQFSKLQASETKSRYLMLHNASLMSVESHREVENRMKKVDLAKMTNFRRLHQKIQENISLLGAKNYLGQPKTHSIHEHLIKLTMFLLASMICLLTANCQRHLFHQQHRHQPLQHLRVPRFYKGSLISSSNEQQVALNNQIIGHMIRANTISNQNQAATEQHLHRLQQQQQQRQQQPADRRASGTSNQQPKRDDGKLLVCYYTTRKSERYWPKDAREYVFPAEGFSETGGFVPHYEPFVGTNTINGLSRVPLDLNNKAQLAKNQQQQLLFKSAAVVPLLNAPSGPVNSPAVIDVMSPSLAPPTVQATNKAKQQYHQDSLVQMLTGSESSLQPIQLLSTHQTLVIADANKSKQTPAYNFIGDFEPGNNGLIVGTTSTPLTVASFSQALHNGGNNGATSNNNFMVANIDDNKVREQQLLFAPSLSRAFLVGGGQQQMGNNEALDTKSQLLFAQQSNISANANNNLQYQYQQSATTSNLPISTGYNSPAPKLKSAQLVGSEQTPAFSFSGAVSSSPPVPISAASSQLQAHTSAPSTTVGSHQRNNLIQGGQVHFSGDQKTVATNSARLQSSMEPLDVKTSANNNPMTGGQSMPQSSSSLSSALVSSPLSTMFDVFGAASQYLMRFKPTSLISPSSFTFNTISSGNLRQQLNHNQLGMKTSNTSSSMLDLAGSSSSSLVPLSFSSTGSLIGQQKSPSTERSSSSSNGGIWSRFSGQNNQHREDVCGRTIQTPQRRIIGGEGARYGEFPYQVHIKIAKHQCGGALVDKQSIVTAAHCVYHFITRAPVSKLQIVIGAYDIEDEQYQELPPQYFKVSKVKLHPNFRFSASHPDRYDIAILKLDKPVKYTDNVLPVCLPSKDLKFDNTVGTVTGFGKTDPSLSNRYGTRLLQKVDVPIIENNECERWHRTRGIDLKIFPEMMCAGYEDGLKDACVGDSGGPLVVKTPFGPNGSFRWTLAGITSAGFGCAQSRQPGIYHRVSHTVDWILENLD